MELTKYFKDIFSSKDDPFKSIVGQDEIKNSIKSAILARRHIIIVGPPGIGKTSLAKNVSNLLPDIYVNDCGFNCSPEKPECPICNSDTKKIKLSGEDRFVRIQGSSDLTVEDIVGQIDPVKALKFGPFSIDSFSPGKIFRANKGILFFDEINRAPEKVQNSLLQVLEEKEVTLGGYKVKLPVRFVLIATMNPEDSSTEKLSDVFIDRFDVISMNYPENEEEEKQIVLSKGNEFDIEFPKNLLDFIVKFVRGLRDSKDLEKKPSVRASIGLYQRSIANAFINKRARVTFEDIEAVYLSVLLHRIRLNPSVKYTKAPEDYIKEVFKKISEKFSNLSDEEGDVP